MHTENMRSRDTPEVVVVVLLVLLASTGDSRVEKGEAHAASKFRDERLPFSLLSFPVSPQSRRASQLP